MLDCSSIFETDKLTLEDGVMLYKNGIIVTLADGRVQAVSKLGENEGEE